MKILIVDDDPEVRFLVSRCLKALGGHDVLEAEGLQDCLEVTDAFLPDVILLDYMLAGLDGKIVFEQLQVRIKSRDIPVIFFTSNSDEATLQSFVAMGARGVIRKPIDPMDLSARVEEVLAQG